MVISPFTDYDIRHPRLKRPFLEYLQISHREPALNAGHPLAFFEFKPKGFAVTLSLRPIKFAEPPYLKKDAIVAIASGHPFVLDIGPAGLQAQRAAHTPG